MQRSDDQTRELAELIAADMETKLTYRPPAQEESWIADELRALARRGPKAEFLRVCARVLKGRGSEQMGRRANGPHLRDEKGGA